MTKIYRIIYKLVYSGSLEKEIDIDFQSKSEAEELLKELRTKTVFGKVAYSFVR